MAFATLRNAVPLPVAALPMLDIDAFRAALASLRADQLLAASLVNSVAEISAMYNLANRMAMATNMLPNEVYSGQARPA